jgi:nucleotide-binding universal stress UspA family protein
MKASITELEMPTTATERRPVIRLQGILVPVDLRAGSAESVQYAAALAAPWEAPVTLLHVVQLNIAGEERGIPRQRLLNELGEQARAQLQALVNHLWDGPVTTQIIIGVGRPHREIVEQARRLKSDLIIMSTYQHPGILSALGLNTTARVLRAAPCPVLVLPVLELNR